MKSLHLTNTLSRKKERFRSNKEGLVKVFTFGPSVYRRAHIGNYRTFLYKDVLHRYLEYLGYRVQRVMNFTDVEDKAVEEARKQGVTVHELTGAVEERFLEECLMLGIKIPEIARSSTSVEQAVRLIRILMDKGFAYRHHDYTIAVVEAVTGRPFSSYWLHGEHVLVDGAKMSKSRGNILYPDSLLEKGLGARDIRFALIYTHYCQKLNLSWSCIEKTNRKGLSGKNERRLGRGRRL